ncbi:MAG: type II toxin-antitoxin system VapC family toxin [Nocardioidaceae bacterium]
MIVDTSAIVAILREEADYDRFVRALVEASVSRMSAASSLETAIVIDRNGGPVLSRRLDQLLERAGIESVDVTTEQVKVARAAYRDFGKGSGHPAQLNFGDCFSYALAKVTSEPLLFKGNDFVHTDVAPAVRR